MDVIQRLRAIPFMSHLSSSDLHALARVIKRENFVAGEDIIRQGDFTSRFFIVDEGHVHFRKTDIEGFEHALGSRSPGEYFGMQMFTSQEPSEYTAEAIGRAVLYVLEREEFEGVTRADPGLLQRMPDVLAERKRLTRGLSWLTPGEIVALSLHRHPLALVQVLIGPVLLLLLAVGAALVLDLSGAARAANVETLVAGAAGLLILIALGWGVFGGFDWTDDDFIVTNKRVVHKEQMPLLSESRSECAIDKIQSITLRKTNIVQAVLGLGTIEIRTAGKESGMISFDNVADVEKIRKTIDRQRTELRALRQAEDRERFRRRVGNELQHYVMSKPMEETSEQVTRVIRPNLRTRMAVTRHKVLGLEFREGNTVTWRKHWIVLLQQTGIPLAGTAVLLLVLVAYLNVPLLKIIPAIGFFAVLVFLFLVALGSVIWQWEDWRNDIYQLTDNSIVDIERLPFGLDSRETTALLINVQDARALKPGILNGVFDYGNVEVQVAGGGPSLVFYNVRRPQQIANDVFRRIEAFRLRQRERETSMQSRNIVDALVAYHRLLMQERHANNGQGQQLLPPVVPGLPGVPQIEPPPEPPAADKALTVVPQEDFPPVSEFPPADEFE